MILSFFSLILIILSLFCFTLLTIADLVKNLFPIHILPNQPHNPLKPTLLLDHPLFHLQLLDHKALIISPTGIRVHSVLVTALVVFDALLVFAEEEPALGGDGTRVEGGSAFGGIVAVGVRAEGVLGRGATGGGTRTVK